MNGEVYNFRELRTRYQLRVQSNSDSAVILPLWALLGTDCLPLLDGMWAIAIVDRLLGTLTLARDPFGIKPLYLRTFHDGSIAFASELRALARIPPKPTIDPAALEGYLRFGAVDADRSPCLGIVPFEANSWATFSSQSSGGVPTSLLSGKVIAGDHPLTSPSTARPWDMLLDSLDHHLIADVPTALLLSSGLDSSLLACAARRKGQSLECFTVKMPGQADETDEAAITAASYGHRHNTVATGLHEADLKAFFSAMQRPTIDGLNSFLVCKAIKAAGYRVAISGLGADEAIAGYPHMRYFPLLRALGLLDKLGLSSPLAALAHKAKLSALIQPGGPRGAVAFDALFRELFDTHTTGRLLGHPVDTTQSDSNMRLTSLIDQEVANYLQRTLLPDADAFSMCSSVELRVPFLEVAYFRAAATSARPFRGKTNLAKAADDGRINTLRRRPKRGFSLPMSSWMADGPLRATVQETRRPVAPVWDFLDRDIGLSLIDGTPPGRWATAWAIVSLNQWITSYNDA